MGPLFFVVVSEVFPQPVRGQAMGAAYVTRMHYALCSPGCTCSSLVAWLLNVAVTLTFPLVPEGTVFGCFLGVAVLCLCYAIFFVPETRGKHLENISV